MTVINWAGQGNFIRDGVRNIKQVIEDNKNSLSTRINDIYTEDIMLPNTPSVAIVFNRMRYDLRSASLRARRNYTFHLFYDIWYYHSELSENVKHEHVSELGWEISMLFVTDITINCFVPKLGCEVEFVRYRPRLRGNKVIASALVSLVAHKLKQVNE